MDRSGCLIRGLDGFHEGLQHCDIAPLCDLTSDFKRQLFDLYFRDWSDKQVSE
jgi:hypothetical protein